MSLSKQSKTVPVGTETHERLVVLVIEDDETDRFRLIKLCRRAGLEAEFHCAMDLSQMQKQLDTRRFDLAFIDYHLGLATGQEALEILHAHEDHADAVAIMVTSVDKHEVIIRAMRSGCADYLIKEEISVETIRKSVMAAFERLLMTASLEESRAKEEALGAMITRFRDSMEPEMRRIMSAMLWRIRDMDKVRGPRSLRQHRQKLEELCLDLIRFLDTSKDLLTEQNDNASPSQMARADGAA